jgi:PAS domain S-box-containing protein
MEGHIGKRILIVEDNAILALDTQRVLETNGFVCLVVHSGEDAVEVVRTRDDLHLVLMDIDLGSGIDGTEAARRVLGIRDLPVVFLSAHSDKEYVDRARAVTNYGYVSKNAGEFVLLESIQMALTLFETSQRLARENAERRQTQQTLQQSEEMMRYIIKHDPNAIAVYDKNLHYIAVSDRYIHDYGIEDQPVVGRHHYEVFPEMPERWKDVHQRVLMGHVERSEDDWFRRTNGSITYNRWECRPWYQKDGSIGGMITYTEVTTERKQAELALRESEERLRTTVEKLPIPVIISEGTEERGVFVNDKFMETFGYELKDVATVADWWQRAYPDPAYRGKIRGEWERQMQQVASGKQELAPIDAVVTCADGSTRRVSVRGYSVGKFHIVAFVDLTEEFAAREQLARSVQEKQYLVDELNHRVKNNLAMVASLIRLKDSDLGDAADLSDLANQVNAIVAVHERLRQSDRLTHIRLRDYIDELLRTVLSYREGSAVTLENRVDDIEVPTRTAVSLGLIINELATNAVKHAFAGVEHPRFSVTGGEPRDTGERVLEVSNTGSRFPDSVSIHEPRTTGLRLVRTIVKQLGASIELEREPRTTFRIRLSGPAEGT